MFDRIMKKVKIEKIAQTLIDPCTCSAEDTVWEVTKKMNKNEVGSIIVVDGDKSVIGIFTERDLLKKIINDKSVDIEKDPISKFMTPNPTTLKMSDTVEKGMGLMLSGNFRHLIIVGETSKKLIKVCSIKDFSDYVYETLELES